jgi:hypothetical protein
MQVAAVGRTLADVTGSRKRLALPLVLALVVLAFGLPLAFMGATPITNACDDTVPSPDELGETDSHQSLWPPGVRCVSRFSDGRTFEATYVTWYELTMVAVFAAGVWLVCAVILRVIPSRQFKRGVLVATVVFLVANVAFFY